MNYLPIDTKPTGFVPSSDTEYVKIKITQRCPRRAAHTAPGSSRPFLGSSILHAYHQVKNSSGSCYQSEFNGSFAKNEVVKRKKEEPHRTKSCKHTFVSTNQASYGDAENSLKKCSGWKDHVTHPEKKRFLNSTNRVKFIEKPGSLQSTFEKDIGRYGNNPLNRLGDQFDLDRCRTTDDLSLGSTKGTCHIPNYTGHIPAHPVNRQKMHDKVVDPSKVGLKNNLKQCTSHNIPGYSGYIPKSNSNYVNREIHCRGLTSQTTDFEPKPVNAHNAREFGNSSTCVQQFFTLAANTSADGLSFAQKYFKHSRPLEGKPKMGDKTTSQVLNTPL